MTRAPSDWVPWAVQRPMPFIGSVGGMDADVLGWIPHVVVGNGSPYQWFVASAGGPRAAFSHLWLSKNGTLEQYGPFSRKSWAQAAGNNSYYSCECEGFPDEPYTQAQLDGLARLHVWFGFPDTVANAPGQRGIGVHYMGGVAWGGHTCPDSVAGKGPRSQARSKILALAAALRKPNTPNGAPSSGTPATSNPEELDMATAADVWDVRFDNDGLANTEGQPAWMQLRDVGIRSDNNSRKLDQLAGQVKATNDRLDALNARLDTVLQRLGA